MQILNQREIQQKLKRLSIEILENNYDAKEIVFVGINNNGLGFAQMIVNELDGMTDKKLTTTQILLNPAEPTKHPIELGMSAKELKNKVIILVDDVANTGRTLFYAFKPLMDILPKRIEVAVLVDRKHKSFPVKVDYMGLSLATTLRDNIDVKIREVKEYAVFLN